MVGNKSYYTLIHLQYTKCNTLLILKIIVTIIEKAIEKYFSNK